MTHALIDAAFRNDCAGVKRALDAGADPNARDPDTGLTALMIAAGHAQREIMRALLHKGADVHMLDSRAGATALHKACQGGSDKCARLLLEGGAFVDVQCATTGHTPLVEAVWFKYPKVVKVLLEYGAGLGFVTRYGFAFKDHLAYALQANVIGHELLDQCKSAVDARDAKNSAAVARQKLMKAVQDIAVAVRDRARDNSPQILENTEEIRRLLALDPGAVDERYPILNGFDDGHTPLLVACREGLTGIVKMLLNAGADINATDPIFGAVPLHKAVYNGHIEVTGVLAARKDVDLDYQGHSNGYTPLLDAIWHGYVECAEILVEAGARLDIAGHDGKTPYVLATEIFSSKHPLTAQIATAARASRRRESESLGERTEQVPPGGASARAPGS